jgi:hypothetical protein
MGAGDDRDDAAHQCQAVNEANGARVGPGPRPSPSRLLKASYGPSGPKIIGSFLSIGTNSRCSGEMRRYLEEHRWRRRHPWGESRGEKSPSQSMSDNRPYATLTRAKVADDRGI